MDDFLGKPVKLEELSTMIRSWPKQNMKMDFPLISIGSPAFGQHRGHKFENRTFFV